MSCMDVKAEKGNGSDDGSSQDFSLGGHESDTASDLSSSDASSRKRGKATRVGSRSVTGKRRRKKIEVVEAS